MVAEKNEQSTIEAIVVSTQRAYLQLLFTVISHYKMLVECANVPFGIYCGERSHHLRDVVCGISTSFAEESGRCSTFFPILTASRNNHTLPNSSVISVELPD